MKSSLIAISLAVLCLFTAESCKKDKGYAVPESYAFENVNYSGQTQRLDMLAELATYLKSGSTGAVLNVSTMKEMFANQNSPFAGTYTKNIKDKTYPADSTLIFSWFDSLALASSSLVPAQNGTAGVLSSSADSSKKYLFSSTGFEYAQILEKGIMGACFYYQATSVYLAEDKIGALVDNETIIAGEGTAMEHHWDEAFGYFGVPIDFPANKTGIRFFGKYCDNRNPILNSSQVLMDAFILGRAAISNDDHEVKYAQIPILKSEWEKLIAATAIHYLNEAKANFGDDALRNHALSEAWAFIFSLKYNAEKSMSQSQIDAWLASFGTNFYSITLSQIDSVRDAIATAMAMESIKSQL